MPDDKKTNVHYTNKNGDTVDADITCDECGKDIVVSNEHGMFCEDHCGEDRSRFIEEKLDAALDGVDGDNPFEVFKAMNKMLEDAIYSAGVPPEFLNIPDPKQNSDDDN